MPKPEPCRPACRARLVALGTLLALGSMSCGTSAPAPSTSVSALSSRAGARPGVTPVEPAQVPRSEVGGRVYVPVYSHVYTADLAHPFNLAVTLSVRNTDATSPIFLALVNYHDSDGRLVRDMLTRPLKIAPLAAAEFFVAESDTAAGSSASFLVEWQAAGAVAPPLVEAVMVGTAMNQGVAFTTQGRPLTANP